MRESSVEAAPREEESEFLASLMRAQQGLFAYIVAQVANVSDADDILQETNMVLWRKQEEFEPGTNFWAWAATVARYQTLAYLKEKGRDHLCFDEGLVAMLATEAEPNAEYAAQRQQALEGCLNKLNSQGRELVRLRYGESLATGEIAERLNRSKGSIYDALYRVRLTLGVCIERTLDKERSQ